jgi:ketosteroid isomerase-like protein
MRHRWMAPLAVVLTLASAGCRHTPDSSGDRADVERVFNKYLQSLNGADVALASEVWLQSPDVLVVTPSGRLQGWDNVRKEIYINSLQKQMREPHVQASNVSIVVAGDAAWLVYDFVFTAKWADGRPLTSKGWESHGYERTAEGWRIAHLHYSVAAAPQ